MRQYPANNTFYQIINKLQTPSNGHAGNRLNSFIYNLSRKYSNVDQDEIKMMSLIAILKVSRKMNKVKDKTKLEAYVWKTIRMHVLNYAKDQSEYSKRDRIMNEAVELDEHYGTTDREFELVDIRCDFEKIFSNLKGTAWRLANIIYVMGTNNKKFICNLMGISDGKYNRSLSSVRSAFSAAGYS